MPAINVDNRLQVGDADDHEGILCIEGCDGETATAGDGFRCAPARFTDSIVKQRSLSFFTLQGRVKEYARCALEPLPIQFSNSGRASSPVFFAAPGTPSFDFVPLNNARGWSAKRRTGPSVLPRFLRSAGASRRSTAAFLSPGP